MANRPGGDDLDVAAVGLVRARPREGGIDALLIRMLVLKEITDAAASRSTLGVGEVSLRPALQGSVDLPKITTAMPEDAELDDEEWADAAVDAINDVADQIRPWDVTWKALGRKRSERSKVETFRSSSGIQLCSRHK